jgi:leucyl/phenylalanyl-tRNA--protein transferase
MSHLPWLIENTPFPSTQLAMADPNGLLAAGGDLSPDRLIEAYRQGIFPWSSENEPLLWWSPNPRCVLYPSRIHISKSLRKKLNKDIFNITFDLAFSKVISHCADIREETWITRSMIDAYIQLHSMGIAHSVEVWHDHNLVGGLYGISLGRIFFGESMFSLMSDSSKIAFVYLAKQLEAWGFPLIDCQVENDHLLSLGAESIPRSEFEAILIENVSKPQVCKPWSIEWEWQKR